MFFRTALIYSKNCTNRGCLNVSMSLKRCWNFIICSYMKTFEITIFDFEKLKGMKKETSFLPCCLLSRENLSLFVWPYIHHKTTNIQTFLSILIAFLTAQHNNMRHVLFLTILNYLVDYTQKSSWYLYCKNYWIKLGVSS